MDKAEIADLIEENYQKLFDWLHKQSDENWETGPKNKWTTSQHFQHLVDSLQLLNNTLSYPRFLLKYKFGTNNRESRDYETIVKNYRAKLLENKKNGTIVKNIKKPLLKDKERLLTRLQIQQKKLQYKTRKISEKNLDTLVIPHPMMGTMTVREYIMWTAYHTEHHLDTLKKYY